MVLHVGQCIFAAHRSNVEIVVPCVEQGNQRASRGSRPLERVDRAQRDVHRKAFRSAEAAFERIAISAKGMHVAGSRTLGLSLLKQIGIAGIETVERSTFVSRHERRNEMIAQANKKSMSPEWRPIFLPEQQ